MQAQAGSEDQPIVIPDMETAPPPPLPVNVPDTDTVHVDKVEVPENGVGDNEEGEEAEGTGGASPGVPDPPGHQYAACV